MHPISVRDISKSFMTKKGPIPALKKVSFVVKEGEIFGLLGPNGAGKTTLINIMLNLLTPDDGRVRIFGQKPGPGVASIINVVSGGSQFHWALTPNQILKYYAELYDIKDPDKRIAELASLLEISDLMENKFGWLSTGEKLRVSFAKALLNKPKLLLLDEPTLGMDPDVARKVRREMRRLNEEGTTILLTSHYMHEVEQLCDRIAFLYQGEIVDIGEVKDVKLKHFTTYDIVLTLNKRPSRAFAEMHGLRVKEDVVRATLDSEEALSRLIAAVHTAGYKIRDIGMKKPTLEDYFIKVIKK